MLAFGVVAAILSAQTAFAIPLAGSSASAVAATPTPSAAPSVPPDGELVQSNDQQLISTAWICGLILVPVGVLVLVAVMKARGVPQKARRVQHWHVPLPHAGGRARSVLVRLPQRAARHPSDSVASLPEYDPVKLPAYAVQPALAT